jgi:hypothetical protein
VSGALVWHLAAQNRVANTNAATIPSEDVLEFVALPGFSGLPDLEIARIVRVELPLAALPAYGLEMVPDAVDNGVSADLLVGQDGVARGIRLIP